MKRFTQPLRNFHLSPRLWLRSVLLSLILASLVACSTPSVLAEGQNTKTTRAETSVTNTTRTTKKINADGTETVEKKKRTRVPVTILVSLYSECDYQGEPLVLPRGRYTKENLNERGIAPRSVASVKVNPRSRALFMNTRDDYVIITKNQPCIPESDRVAWQSLLVDLTNLGKPWVNPVGNYPSSNRDELEFASQCVVEWIERGNCTLLKRKYIKQACEYEHLPEYNDGYLHLLIFSGLCSADSWQDISLKIMDRSLR